MTLTLGNVGGTLTGNVPAPFAVPSEAVVQVEFTLRAFDGIAVFNQVERFAPYELTGASSWDTSALDSGSYALTAVGTTADGRTGTAAATLTVQHPTPAYTVVAGQSIQAAVDAASAGSTITIGPGTYRESIHLTKPIRLVGAGATQTVVKGSDVWGGWTQEGSFWTRPYTRPAGFYRKTPGATSGYADVDGREDYGDQVFVNGVHQIQEMALANVGSGDFWIGNGRLYLGTNPTGQTVEVTTRLGWVTGSTAADDVLVKGIGFRHAGAPSQRGAFMDGTNEHDNSTSGDRWTVEGVEIAWAHGVGIKMNGQGAIVRDVYVHHNGQLGVGSAGGRDQLWERLKVEFNNTEGTYPGHEAGASKWARSINLTVRDSEIASNYGYGLWCDIDCNNVVFTRNRVHHNEWMGISYEISFNALITDNIVYENGHGDPREWTWGAGIMCQNSSGCTVKNNVVAWNNDGIAAIQQNRDNVVRWSTVSNVDMTGNIVAVARTDAHDSVFREDVDNAVYPYTNIVGLTSTFQILPQTLLYRGPGTAELASRLEALGAPGYPEPR